MENNPPPLLKANTDVYVKVTVMKHCLIMKTIPHSSSSLIPPHPSFLLIPHMSLQCDKPIHMALHTAYAPQNKFSVPTL